MLKKLDDSKPILYTEIHLPKTGNFRIVCLFIILLFFNSSGLIL